jgi:hypothetical protein
MSRVAFEPDLAVVKILRTVARERALGGSVQRRSFQANSAIDSTAYALVEQLVSEPANRWIYLDRYWSLVDEERQVYQPPGFTLPIENVRQRYEGYMGIEQGES